MDKTNFKGARFRIKRSPNHPFMDLESSVDKARILYEREYLHSIAREVMIAHWKISPFSGSTGKIISALKKFGLIQKMKSPTETYRVTELAEKIFKDKRTQSSERDQLLGKAFLGVPIYKDVWEKFDGDIPSNEAFEHYLRAERGFNENSIKPFIERFKRGIEYAKLGPAEADSSTADEDPDPTIEEGESTAPDNKLASESESSYMTSTPGENLSICDFIPGIGQVKIEIPLGLNDETITELLELARNKLILLNRLVETKKEK